MIRIHTHIPRATARCCRGCGWGGGCLFSVSEVFELSCASSDGSDDDASLSSAGTLLFLLLLLLLLSLDALC